MEIRIDGQMLIHVRQLQWKFRGNECIYVNKLGVEVYWDVHDWLFSPGLRRASFIFKPIPGSESPPLSSQAANRISSEGISTDESSDYCLFVYAWKME
ncbi:hypothetical protein MLD38_021889 [Melastoma candidum]|nr:hypothetical protein MLD38_021889 [Melastoma candidum]